MLESYRANQLFISTNLDNIRKDAYFDLFISFAFCLFQKRALDLEKGPKEGLLWGLPISIKDDIRIKVKLLLVMIFLMNWSDMFIIL